MKKLLIIPVALYLILSTLYLFAIPPGESPDEPSHLQCIEQVATLNRIPIIEPKPEGEIWWARERIISGLVCAHMPLYYFLTGYTQQALHIFWDAPLHYEFPPNNPHWVTNSPAMFSPPQKKSFFKLAEPISLTVLRLESMLLGLLSLTSVYLITKKLTKDPYTSIFAMTLLAGWPQFLFMSRAINNDVLATACSACTIATLLTFKTTHWKYPLASIFAVLAILSKITMVFTVPAIGISFFLEVVGNNGKQTYIPAALMCLLIFTLLAALLLSQPTLRSHLTWSQQTISNPNPRAHTLKYWLEVLHTTIQSGWARFGWMNILTPDIFAYAWWLFIISTGSVGIYATFNSTKHSWRLGANIIIWIALITVIYLRINLDRFQPQFRYAFSVIPVLISLAATGSETTFLRHTDKKHKAILAVATVLSIVNLWLIFGIIAPSYVAP
jgi:hypothetical protein